MLQMPRPSILAWLLLSLKVLVDDHRHACSHLKEHRSF